MGKLVNRRVLQGVAWTAFAALVVAIGVVFLAACDLGIKPLFGLRYCRSSAATPGLITERERERALRARIHEAELRIAQLPACAQTAQLPDAPPPEPLPPPPPPPPSPEPPQQEDQLKIPTRIVDLQGCWQSVRGDLELVDDDGRPAGRVRACYCLGANGRGRAIYIYADGRKCSADLRAELKSDGLTMRHGSVGCPRGEGPEALDIKCRPGTEGLAVCDTQSRRKPEYKWTDEHYQRVSDEHCGWRAPR
ncbi:MAG TPA: hypothetical protein VEK73_03750 [Xanthobacteraceae bacterium]|nr:hypothetical protein [Xanthobacteraceae bacterium]